MIVPVPNALVQARPMTIAEGGLVTLAVDVPAPAGAPANWSAANNYTFTWDSRGSGRIDLPNAQEAHWDTTGLRPGSYRVMVTVTDIADPTLTVALPTDIEVTPRPVAAGDAFRVAGPLGGPIQMALTRTAGGGSDDQILWMIIRNRTRALSFDRYQDVMTRVMCNDPQGRQLRYRGADAYNLLRRSTELFLMHEVGVFGPPQRQVRAHRAELDPRAAVADLAQNLEQNEETRRLGRAIGSLAAMRRLYYQDLRGEADVLLPYFRHVLEGLQGIPLKSAWEAPPNCYGLLRSKVTGPLAIELIWSYWHEEGMLVQTMKTISRRFQNMRAPGGRDALAKLDVDPLRPLGNLIWGYVGDEQHRLTLVRRAYEYNHQYGLTLLGKAVPELEPADTRTRFLEGFHNLLYRCGVYFKDRDDTTIVADGFPVLNALKDVHLLLAEGAHNQFGDLPWTARVEMLMEQWLLARPEMREFLGGRPMVPYAEAWMDRVDTMKKLQGWTDTTVTHFHDLAVFGEELLLSVRYGDWNTVANAQQAANWADYWRSEIQGYVHAYAAATGIDLSADVTDAQQASVKNLQPALHLRRRLALQRGGVSSTPQLTAATATPSFPFRARRALRRD